MLASPPKSVPELPPFSFTGLPTIANNICIADGRPGASRLGAKMVAHFLGGIDLMMVFWAPGRSDGTDSDQLRGTSSGATAPGSNTGSAVLPRHS